MKIKRVIRFQCNQIKENFQENSNNSEENIQEIQYNASNELIKCVKKTMAEGKYPNMIGFFGSNANVIVNNFCHDLGELSDNLVFIGQADGSSPLSDGYREIVNIFCNYIENIRWNSCISREDIETCKRIVLMNFENVYNCDVKRIGLYMLNIINIIKELIDSSTSSKNHDSKLLVTIEMKELNYNVLNNLFKLKSSDLIIVIFSLYNYDLVRIAFENSFGKNHYCMDMDTFFTGNYVMTEANSI